MVKSVRFLLLLIAFVSMQIVAWGQPQERLVQVQVTPDHTNWLYKPGEKVINTSHCVGVNRTCYGTIPCICFY